MSAKILNAGMEVAPLQELLPLLPSRTRDQVTGLLKQLRREGAVVVKGGAKNAWWYPASDAGFGPENSAQPQTRPKSETN